MSSRKFGSNPPTTCSPDLLVISSHLRRRDERISATRAARLLRAAPAFLARRGEPIEHPFAARAAEGTRISLRWAAEVVEELQKHGMLYKSKKKVLYVPGPHGPAWGAAPQADGTRTILYNTRGQKSLFGHPGRTAANVRAGAERHPVGWVPALPAGFLNTVKPRDVQEAHRATLWPIWEPE